MKRFYLALAMLAALPAAASAQTILNEGFETTSTDQYSPNFPDGWSTVDSYTGNNDRYRWNVYYYEKGTMTGTHCASVDSPMFTGGEDGGEGVRWNNVFGTYSHGPVLPKNPEFADAVLRTAIARKDPSFVLPALDDALENTAHDYMLHRLNL